jgi:hypothetical protein
LDHERYDHYEDEEQFTYNAIAHQKNEYEYINQLRKEEEDKEEEVEDVGEAVEEDEERRKWRKLMRHRIWI